MSQVTVNSSITVVTDGAREIKIDSNSKNDNGTASLYRKAKLTNSIPSLTEIIGTDIKEIVVKSNNKTPIRIGYEADDIEVTYDDGGSPATQIGTTIVWSKWANLHILTDLDVDANSNDVRVQKHSDFQTAEVEILIIT